MHNALLILLALLLVSSWFLFIRYFRAQRIRSAGAWKKLEGTRRQIGEQVSGLDVFVDLLANIHEFAANHPETDAKADLYKMVLDSACQVVRCPAGSLMILDQETGELELVRSKGLPEDKTKTARLKLGEGVAGRVAENGKVIIVDDIETDARFVNRKDVEFHLKSLVSIPLKIKTQVIGVLNVDSPEAHTVFSERDIQLLQVLADLIALGMENLTLYNNLQIYYLEMVETLGEALDKEFDPKTHPPADHARSRLYARSIAQELRLPESIIRYVEYASLMRGIGKIGVEEAILRKPEKLTPEEYEKVKRYPEIVRQILSKVQFLSPILPMILYHQERWDGKGYPAGLKGEEIPLGSRIVAVINVYESMVSDRPYRKALPESQIIEELKAGAGTQFDPKVAEAFVRILEEKRISH